MSPAQLPLKNIVRGAQMMECYAWKYVKEDGSVEPFLLSEFSDIRMTVRRAPNPFNDAIYTLSLSGGDIMITEKEVYSQPEDSAEPELLYTLEVLNIVHGSAKTIRFEAEDEHYRDIMFITGSGEALIYAKGQINVEYNKTEKQS